MGYEAKIILDSVGPNGARLTTFELSYPRFVHAELMTPRVFSRNSASSRAIPTETKEGSKTLGLLDRIAADPVLPKWWGKNQSGMQAREELTGEAYDAARARWQIAGADAIATARDLGRIGLHKQIANRIVEPWMFITVVVTATEFDNFFALRDHPDAQPELADVAGKAHALYNRCEVHDVDEGAWHLPYVYGYDAEELAATGVDLRMVSVGRCAAVSYLNQDKRDPSADIARAEKNLAAGHMSPFEHVAQAMTEDDWMRYTMQSMRDWAYKRIPPGNLWGWKQLRKTLPNEHDFSKIAKHG